MNSAVNFSGNCWMSASSTSVHFSFGTTCRPTSNSCFYAACGMSPLNETTADAPLQLAQEYFPHLSLCLCSQTINLLPQRQNFGTKLRRGNCHRAWSNAHCNNAERRYILTRLDRNIVTRFDTCAPQETIEVKDVAFAIKNEAIPTPLAAGTDSAIVCGAEGL